MQPLNSGLLLTRRMAKTKLTYNNVVDFAAKSPQRAGGKKHRDVRMRSAAQRSGTRAKEAVSRHPLMEQRFTTLVVPALFHA